MQQSAHPISFRLLSSRCRLSGWIAIPPLTTHIQRGPGSRLFMGAGASVIRYAAYHPAPVGSFRRALCEFGERRAG
jgi:hypothetical protein